MAANKDLLVKYYTGFDTYRKHLRLMLFCILASFCLIVGIIPQFFDNAVFVMASLVAAIGYLAFYSKFLAKHVKSPHTVGLAVASVLLFVVAFVYLSGGNSSIFIGILFAFTLTVGILVGRKLLIAMAILLQIGLISFAIIPTPIQPYHPVLSPLLQLTVVNAICFIAAYIFAGEYEQKRNSIEEVRELADQQKKITDEKDELIAIVSHEFRTPLTAIKGYMDLMRKSDIVAHDDNLSQYTKYIIANLAKLDSIVEKTINVSVIDAGVLSLFFQPVNIEKLVSDTIDSTFHLKAEIKKLALEVQLPTVRLPLISADPQYLRLVVMNLVDDSIKYTDEGKVTVILLREGDWVVLTVSDTGRGIAAKDIPHLFQKFYRADDYKTRTTEGTGLGLYLTKHIVDRHHGTISIQSTLGKGTTFTVRLPISKEDETWST